MYWPPIRTAPSLKLDDGRWLTDSAAICRVLEETQPEFALLGSNPADRAVITDLDLWIEMHGLLAVMEALRNAMPRLQGRALAERGRERFG